MFTFASNKDKQMKLNKYLLGLGLIIAAIGYRFLPHAPNFSPMNAIFLFAGATLLRKYASLVGILALVYLSDFALNNTLLRGFYPDVDGIVWFSTYMIANVVSFIAIFGIGQFINSKNKGLKVAGGALLASAVFFLFTNIGSWAFDPLNMYANSFGGLIACLGAGIPFFQHQVIGDLVFSGVLFGSYELITNYAAGTLAKQKA
jgi:hypothetical protein